MPKRNRAVNIFLELVQIDSPTGHEWKMSNEVKNRIEKLGLKAKIDKKGNVLTKVQGNPLKETYMLNAHLDTVEPGRGVKPYIDNKGWIRSKGETILGADNKTAVAAILATIFRLTTENNKQNHPLEIIFTVSEESGNYGAASLDYSKIKSKLGYSFDVSNANFGDIIISSPFYNRFDIWLIGKSAHAKSPELGINILPILTKALSKIKFGRVSKNTLVNVGIVRSGDAVNSIPGEMIISGEVRSTVENELEKETKKIIESFKKEAKRIKVKIKTKVIRENGGYKISKKDEFVKDTVRKIKSFGIKPKLIDSFGCADVNIFSEYGIKMLSIADGSIDNHTSRERIKMTNLDRLENLIYELIVK